MFAPILHFWLSNHLPAVEHKLILKLILTLVFVCMYMYVYVYSVFIGVSDREETHGNIRKLKEKKRNDEDLKSYKEWLKRASTYM